MTCYAIFNGQVETHAYFQGSNYYRVGTYTYEPNASGRPWGLVSTGIGAHKWEIIDAEQVPKEVRAIVLLLT